VTDNNRRRSFQAFTGISIAGFIALLAVNLKPIIDAFAGVPQLLMTFAKVLPLGTSTFFLVIIISGFCWLWAVRAGQHDFTAAMIALGVALGLMLASSLVTSLPDGTTRAAASLQSLMLGMTAGFIAPYLFKGLALLGRWLWDNIAGVDP
jgi:hypothetical protein